MSGSSTTAWKPSKPISASTSCSSRTSARITSSRRRCTRPATTWPTSSRDRLGVPNETVIENQTMIARRVLREKFLAADIGISGANFLVADSGAVVLVENEGNARLTTSAPHIHIAVAGIEKLIPRAQDLAVFLKLLGRSATGQPLTVYTSFLSGPRRERKSTGRKSSTSSCSTTAAPSFWPTATSASRSTASAAAPASTTARFTAKSAATAFPGSIRDRSAPSLHPQFLGLAHEPGCRSPPACAAPAPRSAR